MILCSIRRQKVKLKTPAVGEHGCTAPSIQPPPHPSSLTASVAKTRKKTNTEKFWDGGGAACHILLGVYEMAAACVRVSVGGDI